MTDHILEADQRIKKLQEEQLAWAETSRPAQFALWEAHTRAVLHLASRLNATVDSLDSLRIVMGEKWSVEVERAGTLSDGALAWNAENCCVDGYNADCEIENLIYLIEELWPDVVLYCEESARRVLT